MKNYLLGAAAALAVVAPGIASAQSGDIGVSYGSIDVSSSDLDIYGLNGAFTNQTGHGNWVVQFDAASERLESSGSIGAGYAAANLGVRNEGWAFYGFAGFGEVYYASTTNVGLGGQLYFDRATVNGSIGHADFDSFDASVTDLAIDGTWFFTDNFGVTGAAGFAEAESSGSDFDFTRLGIAANWRPDGTNFTIGGGYDNVDADGTDIDVWKISLSYNFGTATERERSQSGASFNGARRLYDDAILLF